MISTSDLKRGAMMELDGQIVQILSYEHQKIGRGSAQVRLKVKNIRSGAIFDTTAQAGAKWPRIRLDQRQVQYLYSEGELHFFMDKDTYEQFPLSPAQLGDAVNFLKDGMELEVLMYENEPVGVGHADVVGKEASGLGKELRQLAAEDLDGVTLQLVA